MGDGGGDIERSRGIGGSLSGRRVGSNWEKNPDSRFARPYIVVVSK
jgi:hypothetical protein